MINEEAVIQEFIDVVRLGVGSQLAQVGEIGSQHGAVTRKRSRDPAPPQPYIVVGIEDRFNTTPLGINKTTDASDFITHERLESFLFSFRCYGTEAGRIINDLHIYLDIDSVRDAIRADTGGAIRTVENPEQSAIQIGDRYVESSSFNLVWVGENKISDPTNTIIETITVTPTFT